MAHHIEVYRESSINIMPGSIYDSNIGGLKEGPLLMMQLYREDTGGGIHVAPL